ncbi:MAG: DMT family transporter [Bacteroidaceae bacterium]|nr:DMT family transporter [Bacteroidaceae bacterium]
MWLGLAFLSAFLLGFYDISKKKVLRTNPVVPVLCLNTFFSSLIFLPFILCSANGWIDSDSMFFTHTYGWEGHKFILLKSVIVMGSWLCGYFGIKNLPLTIVGPINATRPVMVLIGALTFLGEHLNIWQWVGVIIAIVSFYLLSRSGRKEGIDFRHDKWIALIILSNILGAASALFDRWLLDPDGVALDKMALQSWYNIYQCLMLSSFLLFRKFGPSRDHDGTAFHWDWCILCISLFLSAADFVYFYALTSDDAMVSIVSMIRRGSVVVSFLFAALVFREKNLRYKVFDLLLVMLSLLFLFYGSR